VWFKKGNGSTDTLSFLVASSEGGRTRQWTATSRRVKVICVLIALAVLAGVTGLIQWARLARTMQQVKELTAENAALKQQVSRIDSLESQLRSMKATHDQIRALAGLDGSAQSTAKERDSLLTRGTTDRTHESSSE
jgi:hypothetical protein